MTMVLLDTYVNNYKLSIYLRYVVREARHDQGSV